MLPHEVGALGYKPTYQLARCRTVIQWNLQSPMVNLYQLNFHVYSSFISKGTSSSIENILQSFDLSYFFVRLDNILRVAPRKSAFISSRLVIIIKNHICLKKLSFKLEREKTTVFLYHQKDNPWKYMKWHSQSHYFCHGNSLHIHTALRILWHLNYTGYSVKYLSSCIGLQKPGGIHLVASFCDASLGTGVLPNIIHPCWTLIINQ